MKRIALIIGSAGPPDEYLPGVKEDVKSYKNFLLSTTGGQWYEDEIITLLDKSIHEVKRVVNNIKSQEPDFAFVVFTGHGSYSTLYNQRVLMIGHDKLYEHELRGLAPYELLIIDTCAGMDEEVEVPIEERLFKKAAIIDYRRKYEEAIKECLPQEIILYATSPGMYASDTPKGGLFSQALLEVAYQNKEFEILSALMAWELAAEKVKEWSGGRQIPDYLATVRFGKKLPFSIMYIM